MLNFIVRSELSILKQWAIGSKRKPLIVRGARQVGKSTLVRQLARELGLELLEVNFERNPSFASAFESNDPSNILTTLEVLLGQGVKSQQTLLFLDEIQVAPQALLALRYFYEERSELMVVAAGSLLEFALADAQFSMPVGRIEYFHMGPLSFVDFLGAMGESKLASYLSSFELSHLDKHPFPEAIHNKCMSLYRQFCVVGGMPEAVAAFVESKSYLDVSRVHASIISTYRDDFNKYNKGVLVPLVQKVFDKAPALLGGKLKYVNVSRDYRSADLAEALEQLCMARVLHKVLHTSANGVPLGAEVNAKLFKIVFMDVGLLSSALGIKELDLTKEEFSLVNKGAVSEQFIGQQLMFSCESFQMPSLYYWVREAKSSSAEVDYVMALGRHVIPIEIKSGATGTLKSLHQFCFEKGSPFALRFNADIPSLTREVSASLSQGSVKYTLLSLPLYMVSRSIGLAKEFMDAM